MTPPITLAAPRAMTTLLNKIRFSLSPPQGNAVDNKLQKANFASGRTGPDIDTCRSPQVKFDLRVETLKLMRH